MSVVGPEAAAQGSTAEEDPERESGQEGETKKAGRKQPRKAHGVNGPEASATRAKAAVRIVKSSATARPKGSRRGRWVWHRHTRWRRERHVQVRRRTVWRRHWRFVRHHDVHRRRVFKWVSRVEVLWRAELVEPNSFGATVSPSSSGPESDPRFVLKPHRVKVPQRRPVWETYVMRGPHRHAVWKKHVVVERHRGYRWRRDTWWHRHDRFPDAPRGWLPLVPSETMCSYASPQHRWGTGVTVKRLQEAGRVLARTGGSISVGHLSRKHGGYFPPHASHRIGMDADLRPVRRDGRQCYQGASWRSGAYDRTGTRAMIRAVRQAAGGHVALILFNDPKLFREGLVLPWPGHDNHVHVKFCQYRARDPSYRCPLTERRRGRVSRATRPRRSVRRG